MLVQIWEYCFQRRCLVRFQFNSFTSICLKPGTHPGRRSACSSAVFLMNFTIRSTVLAEHAPLGSRFTFPWTRTVKPFFCSVLPGCKFGSCVYFHTNSFPVVKVSHCCMLTGFYHSPRDASFIAV